MTDKAPTPQEIVAQREGLYSGAWMLHGELLKPISSKLALFAVKYAPLLFPWHMIFNKLLRILTSPMKKDHWLDIQGYAQLVINMLETLETTNESDKESD